MRRASRPLPSRSRAAAALVLLASASLSCRPPATPAPETRGAPPQAATPQDIRAEFLAEADRLDAGSNRFLGLAPMRDAEALLARPNLPSSARFGALATLAYGEVREGRTERAVELLDEAGRILDQALPTMPDGPEKTKLRINFESQRAIALLRHAENRNCIARHSTESCVLPIVGGGVHVEKEPARAALAAFVTLCRLNPDDLGSRYLANLAAMTLGEHPQAVPADLRIAPERFRSARDFPRFVDVAGRAGVNAFSMAGGAAVEDFTGDGLLDIMTSSSDPRQPLILYARRQDGSFEDVSKAAGLEDQLGGLDIVAADFDNDGDPDLLVLRGAWLFSEGRIRKSLLRNDGGRFTDITRDAGLAEPACPTQAAAWGDLDLDGDLDLYVGCETEADQGRAYPSQLFRNEGDGRFVDVAALAGVTNDRMAKAVAMGDIDNDGDLDIHVSNIGPNRLYRNEGSMRFVDVAPELGLEKPAGRSFASWFFDEDNDGWLDLWVPAYEGTLDDFTRDLMGEPQAGESPCLFHNRGDGTFEDIAAKSGLAHPWRPMGADFGDVDSDGWLDIYLGTGDPEFRSLLPNVFLRNREGHGFENLTYAAGLGHLQKGHGVAFADLDEDGDLDIYHQLGGFVRGDRFANALFENPGFDARFLEIELVGTRGNREGRGARIRVDASGPDGRLTIHRCVGCVSGFGGSPVGRQHVGLGQSTAIDRIEIRWQLSAEPQVITGVPLDGRIRVTEGRGNSFEALERHPAPLGGPAGPSAPAGVSPTR